jgi:trans-2,3-dihydro-3-hydroxyanthranilate isomerase
MNKIFNNNPQKSCNGSYWPNPVYQSEGLVWLKAAQPQFFDIFQR